MKRFHVFVLATLLIFLPLMVKAIESSWEKVDEGVETIKFEDAEDFEKSLITRVELLNSDPENEESLTTYRYRLSIIKHDDLEEDIDNKISRTITVNELFATRTDALEYYEALEIEAPEYKGDYDITEVEIERTIEGESNEIVCQSVDCVNEIDTINQSKDENQTLVSSISRIEEELGETKYFRYKNDDGDKIFETESEAKTFAESVKMTLSSGWKFIKNVVNSFKVNVSLSGVFDTEDEATAALNQFKDTYTDVEVTKEITKVRDITEDLVENLKDEVFDNILDATNRVNELNKDKTSDYEINSYYEKVTEKIDENTKLDLLLDKESLNSTIENLRTQGWILDSISIEEISGELTGKVTTAIKDPNSKSSYIFDSNNNYILVKQAKKGTVAVWTEKELTDKAKEEFKNTYKNVTDDGSTSGDLTINFIFGFKTFDLSSLGNGWGNDYTFSKDNNGNIILTIPSKAVSHVVYGYVEETNQTYKVTGVMHKEIDKYIVHTSKKIYGFDYEVEASGNKILYAVDAEAKKILVEEGQKLTYRLDTNVKETAYNLSYEVYSYGLTQYADAEWVIERMVEAKGDGNPDYPNPPQTGNGKGVIITLLSFLTLGLSSIFTKKKEN